MERADMSERPSFRYERSGEVKSDAQQPWYVTLGQVIAIPGAIVLVLLNWSQIGKTDVETTKIISETRKLDLEGLKTQAELQKLLDELRSERSGNMEYIENTLVPKVESAISTLEKIRADAMSSLLNVVLIKFFLIYIVFLVFGVLVNIVNYFWIFFITLLRDAATFIGSRLDRWRNRRKAKSGEVYHPSYRWDRFTSSAISYLSLVPGVLTIVGQLALIVGLVIPAGIQAAGLLGYPNAVPAAFDSLTRFSLWDAYQQIKVPFE